MDDTRELGRIGYCYPSQGYFKHNQGPEDHISNNYVDGLNLR